MKHKETNRVLRGHMRLNKTTREHTRPYNVIKDHCSARQLLLLTSQSSKTSPKILFLIIIRFNCNTFTFKMQKTSYFVLKNINIFDILLSKGRSFTNNCYSETLRGPTLTVQPYWVTHGQTIASRSTSRRQAGG